MNEKYGHIFQEKEEHFTHKGNIKKMVRQQNKIGILTPSFTSTEKKTSKYEGVNLKDNKLFQNCSSALHVPYMKRCSLWQKVYSQELITGQ